MVGPRSLGVCLLTAAFVGMVFTIQFIRWVHYCFHARCDGMLHRAAERLLASMVDALHHPVHSSQAWRAAQLLDTARSSRSLLASRPRLACALLPASEFAKLGLTRSVGGVLALALARELTPVVTSIIIAGRVGSAFAAELGTMQVGEAGCEAVWGLVWQGAVSSVGCAVAAQLGTVQVGGRGGCAGRRLCDPPC